MPTVCCIGEAAGVAIALASKNKVGTRDIDVSELQGILKREGAYIGI